MAKIPKRASPAAFRNLKVLKPQAHRSPTLSIYDPVKRWQKTAPLPTSPGSGRLAALTFYFLKPSRQGKAKGPLYAHCTLTRVSRCVGERSCRSWTSLVLPFALKLRLVTSDNLHAGSRRLLLPSSIPYTLGLGYSEPNLVRKLWTAFPKTSPSALLFPA